MCVPAMPEKVHVFFNPSMHLYGEKKKRLKEESEAPQKSLQLQPKLGNLLQNNKMNTWGS